jgi:hypothetical protein
LIPRSLWSRSDAARLRTSAAVESLANEPAHQSGNRRRKNPARDRQLQSLDEALGTR